MSSLRASWWSDLTHVNALPLDSRDENRAHHRRVSAREKRASPGSLFCVGVVRVGVARFQSVALGGWLRIFVIRGHANIVIGFLITFLDDLLGDASFILQWHRIESPPSLRGQVIPTRYLFKNWIGFRRAKRHRTGAGSREVVFLGVLDIKLKRWFRPPIARAWRLGCAAPAITRGLSSPSNGILTSH